jgi:acyl-CoA synthetase (NDP forming)
LIAIHLERKSMSNGEAVLERAWSNTVRTPAVNTSHARIRKVLGNAKVEGRTALTALEGKQVCDAYGIPVPEEGVARSADEAARLAAAMGFPVVLKIVSPGILHKTEAGGVLVGNVSRLLADFPEISHRVRPQGQGRTVVRRPRLTT